MLSEEVPLSTYAEVLGGFAFKSEDFCQTGLPVVKIANIAPPFVQTEECDHIPPEKVVGLERFRLEEGDILMAMTGATIGKAGKLKTSTPAYLNQRVARISARAGRAFDDFVWALISQPGFDRKVVDAANGSAQANISAEAIGSILVPACSDQEQLAIGRVAGALSRKIDLNHRNNQTLEDLIRALFAHTFPIDPGDELPSGWRAATLGEIATVGRESVQPGEVSGDTPYIGLEHMPRRHIALGEWGTAEGVMSGKFQFREGEILFGKLRPYFHKVGVAPVSGVCSTDILVIRPASPEWFGLVLCHLSSDELIAYTEANSDGTKMPRTSWHALARYPVAIPDQMPAGFNETLSTFAGRIRANIHESRTLAALRDTLLPKLLSGEIRLPQAEKEIATHA